MNRHDESLAFRRVARNYASRQPRLAGDGKPERFFDCGEHRDSTGYEDVSGADTAEAQAARERFSKILSAMPEPKPRAGVSTKEKLKKPRAKNKRAAKQEQAP